MLTNNDEINYILAAKLAKEYSQKCYIDCKEHTLNKFNN
jgi:hypothetical protein